MIAEAIDDRVNRDPRIVGGQDQSEGLRNGFNIWWNTWDDIERMISVAQVSLGDPKGKFLVVAGSKVLADVTSLKAAKAVLVNKYLSGATTPSRMVVEVVNGQVLNDPRIIAGQSQELGVAAGFNRYWTGWDDIDTMLWYAQEYLDMPKGDVTGVFIVVANMKVIGKYELLSMAKAQLNLYPQGAKSPIRLMFQVENDIINDDPRTIAGRNQVYGNNAGFNSYWTSWAEVDNMLWEAEKFLKKPVGDVAGDFLVVADGKVQGRFDKLSLAQDVLNKYPSDSKIPIRCILEVKNGKVDNDPRYIGGRTQTDGEWAGFNFYWPGWDEMDKMIALGESYLNTLNNPSPSPSSSPAPAIMDGCKAGGDHEIALCCEIDAQ